MITRNISYTITCDKCARPLVHWTAGYSYWPTIKAANEQAKKQGWELPGIPVDENVQRIGHVCDVCTKRRKQMEEALQVLKK